MEKTREVIKSLKNIEHSFYCDECEKHIGTSIEYDDGWYQEFGEFKVKIYIDGWYRLKKCLCDNCRYEFVEKLKKDLYNLEFVKE